MRELRYAARLLRRDWKAGELRLLAVSLILAVTAITAVAWLADRVAGGTEGRAAELLGADRAVVGSEPLPEQLLEAARERELAFSRTLEFPSVVLFGEQTQLSSIKAVEPGYPLRGSLLVGDDPDDSRRETRDVPPSGEVWVEPRLLLQLDAAPGDTIELGASRFTIGKVLFLEPDRGGGFQNLSPRLMMNHADVADTGLVQGASRVRHGLLVAGPDEAVAAWGAAIEPLLGDGLRLQRPGQGQAGVGRAIEAAQRFLGLSALLTVVVGGVGMLLTIRRYAARHLDRVAIMRCLGATERQIGLILSWKMFLLGLITAAVGTAFGFGLHLAMLALVADLLPELPAAGWRPAATGLIAAQIILLGFALPTVLRLRRVPPLRVLRRDLGEQVLRGAGAYPVALGAVFLLMWWQAGDLRLALWVFAAVLGTLLVLGLAAFGLVQALRMLRRGRSGVILRLSGLTRRPLTASIQIMALGLGLMALLLLTVVRGDLLATWQDSLPADAANHFLINIQPDEAARVEERLREADIEATVYPMVRGRLVQINDQTVRPDDYPDPQTRRLMSREFNLSQLETLPEDNRVAAGRFWDEAAAEPAFSVEVDIAERLGVSVGDTLTFEAGGSRYSATVSNLREVRWDSFNVNFFVASSPGVLDDAPATYITSFHLPAEQRRLMTELVRAYPSVTVIDIDAILETVRGIMDQGTRVVELMALLTLFAGIVVLLAALQVTREERRFEGALLRSVGASRELIRRLALGEFLLLGGTAGLLAGLGAAVAGQLMASRLFELEYAFNPWLPLLGAAAGALVVTAAGLLATRGLYRSSPMQLLKGAEEG